MRPHWFPLSIVALLGLTLPQLAPAADTPARPNVLFIAVDDLKPRIGCYGDPLAKTPNIDRLAARGMVFTRAYCMQAVCSPSRNAILTGLRPQTLRIYDLGTNFRKSVPDVVTLPQHFKNHGYKTEAMGKLFHVGHGNHEDPASWSVPHWQAKSIGYALPENKAEVTREEALFENKNLRPEQLPRGAAVEAADVPDDAYGDGKLANEAVTRLKVAAKTPDQPFFIAVGFLKPHLPFCAPQKYWDLHDPAKLSQPTRLTPPEGAPAFAPQSGGELRNYANMPKTGPIDEATTRRLIHGYYAAASYMDAQLGKVLDALDETGLAKNTIIVFWGDHGWHLGDHGIWCKHTNYEQATRAPLIVVAPQHKEGVRSSTKAIAEFVDVYPTLCDLTGLEKPAHLQGDSLVPLLGGTTTTPAHEVAFQVYPRSDKDHGPMLGQAVRTDRWRYVEWQKREGGAIVARELYDMESDPDETVNIADKPEQADVVARHSKLIADQLAMPHPAGLKVLPMGAGATPAKPKQDRAAMFRGRDKNGDGKLTREEFLANQPDPDQAPARFPRFDTNGDGVLSEEEFVKAGKP
ncbi:sulfatase-like hydrolase/transferase [Planctomyces sp. SH-PL14]|uniref:sulfatase-like hydrolase/transferase n=1 Tax=Planctomyces sp. SH-PL14 TaxID=1632864 RepID=UPI00078E29A7|nr:sulfatase-like hydrolase/transferase [Planctomyces sp. SH-PL14]AMV19472.1 Choline-sulfatase [Planctomyces sp. SH-PL14]